MGGLKQNASLTDLQAYLKELCQKRGWDKNNYLEIFLLFSEEVGELAKAIRNYSGLYKEEGKNYKNDKEELSDELADVLNYLLDIANYFDINLDEAFRKKEMKNAKRNWN